MKTGLLIIIALGMMGFLAILNLQYADAICVRNQDWSAAPCYGCPDCTPTLEEQKDDWAPYYNYKGAEFMEQKKQEMLHAIQNNQLDEWLGSGPRDQNSNVYHYYELHGITNEVMFYGLSNYIVFISVTVVSASGIGIFIITRK